MKNVLSLEDFDILAVYHHPAGGSMRISAERVYLLDRSCRREYNHRY
jgi:hypothetical protein